MLSAILILAALPWLDTSKIRSAVFRPLYKQRAKLASDAAVSKDPLAFVSMESIGPVDKQTKHGVSRQISHNCQSYEN